MVAKLKQSLFVAEFGVKDDLKEEVAQLFFDVGIVASSRARSSARAKSSRASSAS